MLKKIDCVMIYVEDVSSAADYYETVFGLRRAWRDETSCGLAFPETDAEIVLHNMPDLPSKAEVHYLVDDVVSAVQTLEEKGCQVIEPPFDIAIGKCAVIKDPFGTVLSILDMTKGSRT
jgi:predicted enzyme related to lactoylglutathione lyase